MLVLLRSLRLMLLLLLLPALLQLLPALLLLLLLPQPISSSTNARTQSGFCARSWKMKVSGIGLIADAAPMERHWFILRST